jgi:aspartate racemase
MKTLGILGGMSWESTLSYYRDINRGVAARRGGLHGAPLIVHSFDFERVAALQRAGDWAGAADLMANAALGLKAAGAEGLLIATNTMHKLAPEVQAAAGLPLLHIGDAVGAALATAGVARAGLLGTRFTMEQPFLREYLGEHHGVEVIVPGEADRAEVHRVIFDELCRGVLRDASRLAYFGIVERLAAAGAGAVVLGCTEIALLVDERALPLPGFDTARLHAEAAVEWILA